MSKRILLVSAAAVALASTARADVIFVPDDASTIQSAIDMAAPVGDTILVWPDTYRETVDFLGKEVALRSLAGPEFTIIDAERQGTVVSFVNGEGPGAVLDGFTVTGGLANNGGGVSAGFGASPTLTSCILRDNEAGEAGGGLFAYDTLIITACTFVDNLAGDGGGAYLSGGATLHSCVFEANEAQYGSSAMFIQGGALALTDCVFDGNRTLEGFGGVLFAYVDPLTIRGCVFTGNSAIGAVIDVGIEISDVILVDTVISDNIGIGFRFNPVNETANLVVSGCRFTGNTGTALSFSYAVTQVEDCVFEDNARGIECLTSSALIRRCSFSSHTAGAVRMPGFPEPARIEDCVFTNNAAPSGAAVWIDNFQRLSLARCTFVGNHAAQSGGAVWTGDETTLHLSDCEFRQNTADGTGGAVLYKDHCSAVDSVFASNQADVGGAVATGVDTTLTASFVDCEFTGNIARRGGAVALLFDQVLELTRCRVSGNIAAEEGGGILNEFSSLIAADCTIEGNQAAAGGGVFARYEQRGPSSYVNCLFTGNTAGTGGGLNLEAITRTTIVNSSFFGNTATSAGGALFFGEHDNNATLANCVLWENVAPVGHEISKAAGAAVSIRYSDIEGCGGSGGAWDDALGADTGGNIDADPIFVDAPTILRLGADSPCIDAADNSAVPAGVTTDAAGLPRFADDPLTIDTGAGDPPIVDMGAYEFQAACVGDIDADGRAGFSDLLAVLAAWGNIGGPEDLDGSGVVDFGDVVVLVSSWGPCP